MKRYYIGVDAGNTKTTIAISATTGGKIRIVKAPAGGIATADILTPLNTIRKALKATKIPRSSIAGMHIGIAGLDSQKTLDTAYVFFEQHFPKTKFSISNDVINALRSGTEHLPAIALIAGTGTHCYGLTQKGKVAQTAGLNYLLADEGGGYWIGLHLLKYAARSADGRFPRTIIKDLIFKHFTIKDIHELPEKLFALKNHKRDIAQLAHYLTDELVAKDALARRLATHAAQSLALNVTTVAQRLNLNKQQVDVVLVGGILTGHQYIQKKVITLIKKSCPKATIIIPTTTPEIGALELAKDLVSPLSTT